MTCLYILDARARREQHDLVRRKQLPFLSWASPWIVGCSSEASIEQRAIFLCPPRFALGNNADIEIDFVLQGSRLASALTWRHTLAALHGSVKASCSWEWRGRITS